MRLPGGGRTLEGKQLLRGNEYIRGYQHLRDQPASKGKNALAGRINLRPRIAGLILSAKQLKDAHPIISASFCARSTPLGWRKCMLLYRLPLWNRNSGWIPVDRFLTGKP
jgi:hypothetical protein